MMHTRLIKFNIVFLLWTTLAYSGGELQERLKDYFFSPSVTSLNVSDWYNPTIEDYRLIQEFLHQRGHALASAPLSVRPFGTRFLNDNDGFYGWLMYRFRRYDLNNLVGDGQTTLPERHIIYCNNDPNSKKNCVICYITAQKDAADPNLARDYTRGIEYIIESLKKHNFDGHFMYYIGGWPGLEKGRLKYVDVPYSFKPFLFEEARDLGYENVLWLDACCVPVKNLDPIFEFLEKNGVCFPLESWEFPWNEMNLGYKLLMPFIDTSKRYIKIYTQFIGLNMKDHRATQLLDAWISTAEDKIPFLQSDEPPFVFLANELNLMHGILPRELFLQGKYSTGDFEHWRKNDRTILYHQYDFLNPRYRVPVDIFDH